MQAGSAAKIETGVDRCAAALFACAAAFAAYSWLARHAGVPLPWAQTVGVGALAYLLCVRMLGAVQLEPRKLPVPVFHVRDIDADEPLELLLTDRCAPTDDSEEPLVLDDVLAGLPADSRVVRLFDPAAMPTPGQLNARIERHLASDGAAASPPDASQALHDALAELRRSLG